MHLLTNSHPIPTRGHGTIEPGSWVCDDVNAAELLLMGKRGTSIIRPFQSAKDDLNADNTPPLLMRSGAIGDLLFLSPAIHAWNVKYPGRGIGLCCFEKHKPVAADFGCALVSYPLRYPNNYNLIVPLENVMESDPTQHATDNFARALGVTVTDYKPRYFVHEFESFQVLQKYPKTKKLRVGIQCLASVENRSYPLSRWVDVIQLLIVKNDCEVFLFGHKGQLPELPTHPNLVDLTKEDTPFRQSAAILSTCDAFCGVDSALLHLCHALDLPAVGLFAAFDWKTRTAKAPLTRALTGVGDCAPCSWHKHAGQSFPPDKPCARERVCGVLASIEPKQIVSKLLSLPVVRA